MGLSDILNKSNYEELINENIHENIKIQHTTQDLEKSEIVLSSEVLDVSNVKANALESGSDYGLILISCFCYLVSSLLGIYFSMKSASTAYEQRSEMWKDVNEAIEKDWSKSGLVLRDARSFLNRHLIFAMLHVIVFAGCAIVFAGKVFKWFIHRGFSTESGRISFRIAEIFFLIISTILWSVSSGIHVVNVMSIKKDQASLLSMGSV